MNNQLLPFLNINPAQDMVSSTAPILLTNGPLALNPATSQTLTFDFETIAGSPAAVPEPPALVLCALGLAGVGLAAFWRGRRP